MSRLMGAGWTRRAVLAFAVIGSLLFVAPLAAQQGPTGGSLRPYWHIFIAYAVAWVFVVAWLVHIARRLRRVTEDGS